MEHRILKKKAQKQKPKVGGCLGFNAVLFVPTCPVRFEFLYGRLVVMMTLNDLVRDNFICSSHNLPSLTSSCYVLFCYILLIVYHGIYITLKAKFHILFQHFARLLKPLLYKL